MLIILRNTLKIYIKLKCSLRSRKLIKFKKFQRKKLKKKKKLKQTKLQENFNRFRKKKEKILIQELLTKIIKIKKR